MAGRAHKGFGHENLPRHPYIAFAVICRPFSLLKRSWSPRDLLLAAFLETARSMKISTLFSGAVSESRFCYRYLDEGSIFGATTIPGVGELDGMEAEEGEKPRSPYGTLAEGPVDLFFRHGPARLYLAAREQRQR